MLFIKFNGCRSISLLVAHHIVVEQYETLCSNNIGFEITKGLSDVLKRFNILFTDTTVGEV